LPHWDSVSYETTRAFGNAWYDQRRTVVLIVPSVVTRLERNILINQEHPDFKSIRASEALPVRWDKRLWT
jgi:RES domain-containing protein